jgi:sulfonate transport system substrate-binding protein
VVYDELRKTGLWVKPNPKEAAAVRAPLWGLDFAAVALTNSRLSHEVRPVVIDALKEQQSIADVFYSEGMLPKKINASSVVLRKPAN